jgi:molybdopterin-guanine dinucleotide biosynthesis protein A
MGRDKALLPYRNRTLAEFVAGEVSRATGSAVLVGDPQIYDFMGLPIIPDLYPNEGPLGGILTALAHTSAQWNLLAACDMPALSAAFLELLLERAEATNAGVLLPINPVTGWPEPLCAVYRPEVRPALAAAFERGTRKVTAALDSLPESEAPVVRYATPELASFLNVNTPEEWARVDF